MTTILDEKKNFLGLPSDFSSFERSAIVVVPAPYEANVTYGKGTRWGPAALLAASHRVERFDEETKRDIAVERGIATLAPVNFGRKKGDAAVQHIHDVIHRLVTQNKFVVTLGGEHTVTAASVAAYIRRYPDLSVLQLDAHADLRASVREERYSHASVMARVCEFLDPARLVQVGVRSLAREEEEFITERGVHTYYAHTIRNKVVRLLRYWMDDAIDHLTGHVYITVDVDVFDPSIMPATGSPEPNGLLWNDLIDLIKRVARKRKIVGFDVVEFSPINGVHHPNLTAAKMVSKILNYAC